MKRAIGIDIHRDYAVIVGVNAQQAVVLPACKVAWKQFPGWCRRHLDADDQVALEATSNAWQVYDDLVDLVAQVHIANSHQIKLIGQSSVKTDQHDALVLAKLLVANLLPTIWVPPPVVRELRALVAHRERLLRDRTAARNRLHALLHRHNIALPEGNPFGEAGEAWWLQLPISSAERLRMQHELLQLEHVQRLINEVEQELTLLSVQGPWAEQAAFVMQIPGFGVNSTMTVLSAIGDIGRFETPEQLVGYSGLGARRHESGKTHHSGKITKEGRRELRAVLVECARVAVRWSEYWQGVYEGLATRMPAQKAIVAVARKLLVVIWHVLTKRTVVYHTPPEVIARSFMTWAAQYRLATSLGLSRPAFVWQELDRLGIGDQLDSFYFSCRTYRRSRLTTHKAA